MRGDKFMIKECGGNSGGKEFEKLKLMYLIFKFLPCGLFLAFSIASFGLLAAPLAVGLSVGFSGEKILLQSCGSTYEITFNLIEFSELRSYAIALCVIALINIIFSVIACDVKAVKSLDNAFFKVGKKRIKFGALSLAAIPFCSFVTSVICVTVLIKIAILDQGAGLITGGACPIAIMACALVVFLFSTVAFVINNRLEKKYNISG